MTVVSIDQSKLFFIIGIGRSGTSILQETMNTFDGFCNTLEARWDGPGSAKCYSFVEKNNDFTYLEDFMRENWTKEYFVEKTPGSYNFVKQLAGRYPNANYIFLQRHPLKIVLSKLNQGERVGKDYITEKRKRRNLKGPEEMDVSYEEWIASKVLAAVKKFNRGKDYVNNKISIRYEDLTGNLENTLTYIADTFHVKSNIELAKARLTQPAQASKKNTHDITQLTKPKAIEDVKEACRLWGYEYDKL